MKTIVALAGQTVYDIALQEMGSIEGVFEILDANPFIRLDMALSAGTKVFVPDTVIDAYTLDYLTRNNIHPVSGTGEELSIDQQDMINIKQTVAYDLADGDKVFDGVRLANMGDELSVQLNYSDLTGTVNVYIEQSLDGTHFSPVDTASYMLDTAKDNHTFNLYNLVTNYCRIRLVITGSGSGIVDEIIWRQ